MDNDDARIIQILRMAVAQYEKELRELIYRGRCAPHCANNLPRMDHRQKLGCTCGWEQAKVEAEGVLKKYEHNKAVNPT